MYRFTWQFTVEKLELVIIISMGCFYSLSCLTVRGNIFTQLFFIELFLLSLVCCGVSLVCGAVPFRVYHIIAMTYKCQLCSPEIQRKMRENDYLIFEWMGSKSSDINTHRLRQHKHNITRTFLEFYCSYTPTMCRQFIVIVLFCVFFLLFVDIVSRQKAKVVTKIINVQISNAIHVCT